MMNYPSPDMSRHMEMWPECRMEMFWEPQGKQKGWKEL